MTASSMIFTINLFNPIKSLKYFEEYFENVSSVEKDSKIRNELLLLTILGLLKAIQGVVLYLAPFSLWTRILLVDYAVYFNLPVLLDLMCSPIPVLIVFYIRILYFGNNNTVMDLIKKVVVEQNNRYFLYELVDNKKVSSLVRKYTLIALMANQPFIISIGIFWI